MKKTRIILLVIALAMILAMTGCGKKNKTTTTAITTTPPIEQQYIHIAWANTLPDSDDDILRNGKTGAYLGVYTGTSKTAPANYEYYQWANVKGEAGIGIDGKDGKDGVGLDGKDGQNGLSAYQIAVNNGFVGTEQEWLASLKGRDGQNGQVILGNDGLSAYQIAVNNGFVGTEQEWLASLKGADGKDAAGNSGLKAHIISKNYNVIDGEIDVAGNELYYLTVYAHQTATPQTVSVSRYQCYRSNSLPDYYILSGDPSQANGFFVISIPIIPMVSWQAGQKWQVSVNGCVIDYVTLGQGVY